MKGTRGLSEGIRATVWRVLVTASLCVLPAVAQEADPEEDPCASLGELQTQLTAAGTAREPVEAILEAVQKLHPTCQLTAEAQSILARAARILEDARFAAEGMLAIERLQLPGSAVSMSDVENWLATCAAARLEKARQARAKGDMPGAAILGLEAVSLEPDLLSQQDEHLTWMLGWIETNEAAWTVATGLEGFRRGEAAYLVGDLERAVTLLKQARAKGLDGGRRLKVGRYLELIEAEKKRAETERQEAEEVERDRDEAHAKRQRAEDLQRERQEIAERTREDLETKFRDERRRVEIDSEIKQIEGRLAELAGTGSYEAIPTLDGKVVLIPTDYNKIWTEEGQLKKRRRELDLERSNLK